MANQASTQTVSGLGTTTINITSTDTYNVDVTLELPRYSNSVTQGAGGGAATGSGSTAKVLSQVVTVINRNGTPIVTSAAGARGVSANTIACTAGDTITVVTSSSASQDQQPNAVKATIALSEGVI
jgi:hypothetical protein